MFDKITIRSTCSPDECAHLAQLHRLHVWTNERGTQVEYRSSDYAKLTGIDVKIVRNTVTLKCSLHKYWNLRNFGKLRNDTLFSISEAKVAFETLLFENGFLPGRVRVIQFEIGMNLHVSYDPLTFIELVRFITPAKTMFVDANYRINRQKTTEKHKDIRKYYKVYDKGWEMQTKDKRQKTQEKSKDNILRIETVYRRHNEKAVSFFTDANIERLVKRFWVDWKDLFFFRDVRAYKGARKSEVERARILVNSSKEAYQEQIKQDLEQKKITEKQYRTIREFIRDFDNDPSRFKEVISAQETEYKSLIIKTYQLVRD